MNTVSIPTMSAARLADAWERVPEFGLQVIGAAMQEAVLLLQREAQERAPVGVTGELRNSAFSDVTGTLDQLLGVVGFTSLHAEPVELGTKPHTPPLDPLVDWVEARLGLSGDEAQGVARAIQFKIRQRGTEPQRFFEQAYEATQPQILRLLDAAVGEFTRRAALQ